MSVGPLSQVCVLICTSASLACADTPVPSGQPLELFASDVISGVGNESLLYLGLLAPQIAATEDRITYEQALTDIDRICTDFALPMAREKATADAPINAVIIRLSDRPIMYGETDPEAAQYMGFYDVSAGDCAWQ
ncbi:MAG: hypothetical protein GY952_00705 [Rhodobacteraceae bacterium]|nr:hypothetical protein [Paracoccaceae bacterium]